MNKCKHENGWIIARDQDFDLSVFDGDFVEADSLKFKCNNLDCQEERTFKIVGGIAKELI